jgi:tripartite ATP-independent transporter DctP family solute receptor
MKKRIAVVVCVILAAFMACGGSSAGDRAVQGAAASAEKRVLKIGHPVTEISHWHLGLQRFAELVKNKTEGRVEIEIYPNLTLGSERELIEGMGLGSVDMGLVSTSITGGFTDSMLILDLPYLFESSSHAHKVLDSQTGEDILKSLDKIGIVGLAFFENGFRNITSTKPVRRLADIKGLKIRTVESALYLDTFEAFGANPVPMTWGDVYTALQQKTIDGQEGCNDNTYKAKMHEVTPYIMITNQIYSGIYVAISKQVWNEIPAPDQQALSAAAREASAYQRDLAGKYEMEARDAMAKAGATVIDNLDLTEWRAAVQKVYSKYADKAGGLDRIKTIQAMK